MSNTVGEDASEDLRASVTGETNTGQEQVPASKNVQDSAETDGTRSVELDVPVELRDAMQNATKASTEAIRLLSICAILPDGLRPDIYELLRPWFTNIDTAKRALSDVSLVLVGADEELKPLPSTRDVILGRHPLDEELLDNLQKIYLLMAVGLPTNMDEGYKTRADAVAPELDNMTSILLMTVDKPSQLVVDAIYNFTMFSYWQQPNIKLASALLPHLDWHSQWKAECLQSIGKSQHALGEYREAITTLGLAVPLYLQVEDPASAAWCQRMSGKSYELIAEGEPAQACLEEARTTYAELGDEFGVARCRKDLGEFLRRAQDYTEAAEHLTAAREAFISLGDSFASAQCSEGLGMVYQDQGDYESAVREIEAARSVFLTLGDEFHMAQSARYIGALRRVKGDLTSAEELLNAAGQYYRQHDDPDLALCVIEFGYLRQAQGRQVEAIIHFKLALGLFEGLGKEGYIAACKEQLLALSSTEA